MLVRNYKYTAINENGEIISVETTATNLAAVKQQLHSNNLTLLRIRPKFSISLHRKRIKNKVLDDFVCQLSSLINSGVPILKTIDIIDREIQSLSMHLLLKQIKNDLSNGITISAAFSKHSQYFNELFCNLLYVGEKSGKLEQTLSYLAEYREKTNNIKRKIKKALLYPAAVVIIAIAVITLLLFFVVPQFEKMFQGFGLQLPMFTQLIIGTANIIKKRAIYIIIIFFGSFSLLKFCHNRVKRFRDFLSNLTIHIPIIGPCLKKTLLARFSLILALIYKAGIPIAEGLKISAHAITNTQYQQILLKATKLLQNGQTLKSALTNNNNMFPSRVEQMIVIGEEGGTLDIMLSKIAEYYESEVDYLINNMNNLLEPVIMVILGILIGALIIGIYLPIFKLGTII